MFVLFFETNQNQTYCFMKLKKLKVLTLVNWKEKRPTSIVLTRHINYSFFKLNFVQNFDQSLHFIPLYNWIKII